MSKTIKLRKGFNINLAGKAQPTVVESVKPKTYALKPQDFPGFSKPKLLVAVGDTVKAGTPLYYDKSAPEVKFCSPVSGEIADIVRGEKRKLLEIRVLADAENSYEEYKKYSVSEIANLTAEQIKEALCSSGVWPHFVQRPYAVMANPAEEPKAIFISGFDSNPLAPDYEILFKGQEDAFKTGIDVIKKLTKGKIHLTVNGNAEVSKVFSAAKNVEVNKVSGPHPAGNVGVQIHHIDPVNKGDLVWTLSPYGVIQIGKLFLDGKYDASKIISVAGSEVSNPQYYKTFSGASVEPFVEGNLKQDNVRIISGSVLSGDKVAKDGYIGFHANQLTVIPEGDDYIPFGSFAPSRERLSFQRAVGLFSWMDQILQPNKEYTISSNIQGEHRAFVQSGVMERVLPMDIYPIYLLKAIMAEDYEGMEALGIYEVAEEDLALCEFVDASKHEVQSIIRHGIELMQNS